MLFHIASAADWAAREETYAPASFASDGFIHCSTAAQIEAVAKRLFRGQANLLLLTIDPSRVQADIRYENLEGGEEQFPHIYGRLSRNAVVTVQALHVGHAGDLGAGSGCKA